MRAPPLSLTVSSPDLTTLGSNGHIVLSTTDGSIVINEGIDNDTGVSANGAGNVLLEANGEGRDITVNADITSSTGHLTLRAEGSICHQCGPDHGDRRHHQSGCRGAAP